MDLDALNSVVGALFVTWFIPVAIRDPKTGEYRGFKTARVFALFVFFTIFEFYVISDKYGLSVSSILRTAFLVSFVFSMALLFVKLTQKELFGNEFSMKVKRDNDNQNA